MIRPCDQCHGIGVLGGYVDLAETELAQSPCPRCVDMPWLRCKHHNTKPHRYWVTNTTLQDEYAKPEYDYCSGAFKPDRSTVMRWCSMHNAIAGDEGEIRCDSRYSSSALTGDCDIVWVERPTPLQIVIPEDDD